MLRVTADRSREGQRRDYVILPGMKQRIEVPRVLLTGKTMVLPARFGNHRIVGNVDPLVVDADTMQSPAILLR
jgi:hypothetical protein